jgi:hypothetical protein
MDKDDLMALAAETALLRAFMIELLDGFASQVPDREAFVRDFISRLHLRLDGAEDAVAIPGFAGIFEMARQQADGLGAILLP